MAFITTNNLDDIAIYLGINRLPGETNVDFLSRIKRLSKLRYSTNQDTLVKSIAAQVGLGYRPAMSIECIYPYTISISNEYIVIKSFSSSGEKYKSVFINSVSASGNQQSYPLIKLKTLLDADPDYSVTVIDDSLMNITREQLLTISNFKHKQLIVSKKYTILDAKKILPSSLSASSFALNTQVDSVQDIKRQGDYFYDIDSNYLELFSSNPEPFIISFIEYDPIFILSATDINLLSLSNYSKYGLSDNFINMLELVLEGRGIGSNGSV